MYYQLDEKYAFRGWKKLPYALRIMEGEGRLNKPLFFNKEDFLLLLCCNGMEAVNEAELSENQCRLLQKLAEKGIIQKSGEPLGGLQDYQRYQVYPSIYYSALQWSITGKCNYRCRHCLVSAPSSKHPELPLADCLRIIEQMHLCGVRQVDLTGGEPLLRTDFLEIVRSLTEHGISIRLIFTNASLLNEQLLDALDKLGQHPAFQLSYDGVGCHSWLRGIPQAEEDLLRAIKLLHKRKVDYSCAMCIHKGNAEVLGETVKLLAQYGCRGLGVNTPQELGNWQEFSEKYALSSEETWELYKAYIPLFLKEGMPMNISLDGFFRCGKGSTDYTVGYQHNLPEDYDLRKAKRCGSCQHRSYIDAEGRLVTCMGFSGTALEDKFPSLLNHDMGEASADPFYAMTKSASLQKMVDANPECKDCEHLRYCTGGCMVEGAGANGDWLHRDERCCWFFKNVGIDAVHKVADDAIATYVNVKNCKDK